MKKIIAIIITSTILIPLVSTAATYPFMSQAPTANWKDQRQQDGCEEASSIMAVAWARGETSLPTGKIAEKFIVDMANWETRRYGSNHNSSTKDTADRLLKTYQNFTNYRIVNKITLAELKKQIQSGNVVIAPMYGRKLKNPNYTNGGPELHMLVITGYDKAKKEFITNDPGTRRGYNYRYPEARLYDAIRDYPTGNKVIIRDLGKNVIVVSKQR